jgi:hypothetical protein
MTKLTPLEWLALHLEPHEALELRAACDSLLKSKPPIYCPICWVHEEVALESTVSGLISNGFLWNESPQGSDYWKAVHAKYAALEAQKKKE